MQFLEQSKALKDVLAFAESICKVTDGTEIGTEHVLYAMLLNLDLFATRLLEVAGFKIKKMVTQFAYLIYANHCHVMLDLPKKNQSYP